MSKILLILAVAVMGASCGAAGAGSCAITGASGYCIGYTGSAYTASSVQSACSAASGTYSASACAAGSGVCTFAKGTSTEYNWTFASADAGGVSASTTCTTAGGTFSAN